MLKYLFSILIAAYIFSVLFDNELLIYFVSILSMISVIFSFPYVSRFARIIGAFFLILGAILLINSSAEFSDYVLSFGKLLNLLAVFSIVPILAIPIQLGNYADRIQKLVRKMASHSGHFYIFTSGLAYVFSSFMNLATLPVIYYSIQPSAKFYPMRNEDRFLTRAITHGFSMSIFWAPVTPIVGIVVEMNNVSWGAMLPYLIPFSLLGLALDWLIGIFTFRKHRYKLKNSDNHKIDNFLEKSIDQQQSGKLGHIIIAIFLFVLIILSFEKWTPFGLLFIVTALIIPFSFIWSITLGKIKKFFSGMKEHFNTHLLKIKDQFYIFLSTGFFISAVNFSGVNHSINLSILNVKNIIGIEVFLVILPLIPLLLSFIGLHPAVTLALMAEALDPGTLQTSPEILTVAMLGGAVSTFLMGPYNATIGLMSSIVNQNPFKISIWNAFFTFFYMVILIVGLLVLQLFFK